MSIKALSEYRVDAEEAKKELNSAILSDNFSDVEKAKIKLNEAIKEYNNESIRLDFIMLRSKSAPMMAAIEQLSIATIEAKANKDKDSGIITYTIEPAFKQISLPDFNAFCEREKMEIAPDRLWMHKIDSFCLLVTYRIMKELGQETKKLEDTYYISDIAKQIDLGKTPTSNTQMLKQLQSIIDSIIYEPDGENNTYKATSHDVAYIIQTMTKRGRTSGSVVAPRPQTMHMLVMDVLHKIVTNKSYKVEYVTKKQAKEEAAETAEKTENK